MTDPRPVSQRTPLGPRRATGRDPDMFDVLAAQRDRGAFDVLYRRYLDRVYSYAFYQLGDHHEAEDATERTFLSALSALDRFTDEGATFRAWLFRIAHNTIANAHRDTPSAAHGADGRIREHPAPAQIPLSCSPEPMKGGRPRRWPASPPTGGRRSSSASSTACPPARSARCSIGAKARLACCSIARCATSLASSTPAGTRNDPARRCWPPQDDHPPGQRSDRRAAHRPCRHGPARR